MFWGLPLLLWMCSCISLGLEHVEGQQGPSVPSEHLSLPEVQTAPPISQSNVTSAGLLANLSHSTIPTNTLHETSTHSKDAIHDNESSSSTVNGIKTLKAMSDSETNHEQNSFKNKETNAIVNNNKTGLQIPEELKNTSGLHSVNLTTQTSDQSLKRNTLPEENQNKITTQGSVERLESTEAPNISQITLPGVQGINTTYNSPAGTENNTNSQTTQAKTIRPTDFTTAAKSYENTALITQSGEGVGNESVHKGETDLIKSNNTSTNTTSNDAKDMVNNTLLVVSENSAKSTTEALFITESTSETFVKISNSSAMDSFVTSNKGVVKKSDSKTSQFVTTQIPMSLKGQTDRNTLENTAVTNTSEVFERTSIIQGKHDVYSTEKSPGSSEENKTKNFVTTVSTVQSSLSIIKGAQSSSGPGGTTEILESHVDTTQNERTKTSQRTLSSEYLTSTQSVEVTNLETVTQSVVPVSSVTTPSDIMIMQTTVDKSDQTTMDLFTITEDTAKTNGTSSAGGLSKTAQIGIGLGSVVLFWIILGPLVCLICRLKDKNKARNEPDDEKPRESFSHSLMEQYIMTELARGREKMYQTTLTDENETHKLNDSTEYEQSVDAEITSF